MFNVSHNAKTGEEEEKLAQTEFMSVNLTDWHLETTNSHANSKRNRVNDPSILLHNNMISTRSKRQIRLGSSLTPQQQQRVRTIETAIFVDNHLKQRFQNRLNDLKRLVMATMSEVQLIYNYQSMRIPIRIVISRLEILQRPEEGPNNAGGDIDRYLDNFCSWQAKRHRSSPEEERWDHALMLTG